MIAAQNDKLGSFKLATRSILISSSVEGQAEAVAAFGADAVSGAASRPSLTARNSCAFTATMRVDKLIATAPTLIGSSTPHRRNRPAATGIATKL